MPRLVCLVLALAALNLGRAATAQVAAPAAPAAAPEHEVERRSPSPEALPESLRGGSASVDRVRLAAFVDGVVTQAMRRDQLAGVAIAIVHDGGLLLARGYGRAAIEPERAVDPEQTGFRIGSISKTFTYVAAMQLIEQGRLHPDDPINEHLPAALKIPADGYEEPIRIRHLFTHSAGFEDLALGHLFEREPKQVPSSEDYLVEHRPRRVRPPGQRVVYSNYGAALLGAVIAHVSGQRYEDYVEEHLLRPLGMLKTTLREPLPEGEPRRLEPDAAAAWSQGFRRVDGAFRPQPREFVAQIAAAGGAHATATDMARWMRMLLAEGEGDGGRILAPASVRRMREVLLRNAPEVNGIGYGFITDRIGPHAAYGHGGATLYFHTNMVLLPEMGLGIFVASNTDTGRRFAAEFPLRVVDYLDPAARPTWPATITTAPAELTRFAGLYLNERRPHTRADTLLLAATGLSTVTVDADGLVLRQQGEATRWLPIAPLRFREVEGHRVLAFDVDARDRVIGYALPSGISYARRVGTWRGNLGTLALVFVGAVSAGLGVLLAALWTRRGAAQTRPGRGLSKIVWLATALAWIVAAVLLSAALLDHSIRQADVLFIYPTALWRYALWAATLAMLAAWPSALLAALVWRSPWHGSAKVGISLAATLWGLAAVAVWSWNLVIWRL